MDQKRIEQILKDNYAIRAGITPLKGEDEAEKGEGWAIIGLDTEFNTRELYTISYQLYFDEASDATGLAWFRRCLRQGRSRHVPMICVTQRPVFLDRYVWSEADYYQGFRLNLADDRETAERMVPGYPRRDKGDGAIPEFHSVWHDVKRGMTFLLAPVPDRSVILSTFRDRMPVKRRAI